VWWLAGWLAGIKWEDASHLCNMVKYGDAAQRPLTKGKESSEKEKRSPLLIYGKKNKNKKPE